MSRRQVVSLPMTAAGTPLQMVRLGEMLFSSSIAGLDPETGELGEGPEQQFELAFRNLQRLLDRAGASVDDLGLVTVYIPEQSYRQYINVPWLATFPDENNRPARKTTQYPLPVGVLVQLQAVGLVGQERKPLEISGLGHKDPLPMGARLGNLVFSSVLGGQDPATNKQIDDPEQQVRQAFANMEALVEQSGGSRDDIAHVLVFLRDRGDESLMLQTWQEMFPREGDRPARKTIFYDELTGRATLIQLQMVAVLGQGGRQNFEVPGVLHHDPIPMGARVGRLLFSSGLSGRDPRNNETGRDLEEQAQLAFANARVLLKPAGGSEENIAQMTIMVKDYAHQEVVMRHWRQMFPDSSDEPARHIMALGVKGANQVQLHVVAVL